LKFVTLSRQDVLSQITAVVQIRLSVIAVGGIKSETLRIRSGQTHRPTRIRCPSEGGSNYTNLFATLIGVLCSLRPHTSFHALT